MKLLHGQSAPAVVAVEEQDSAERGQPGLSALPFLDLAPPPHALFVSLATKQCHAHTPPPKPQATPSSERSPTRSSVEQAGQSFHFSQAWGPRSVPPPHLSGIFRTLQPGHPLLFPEKSAVVALGMTWTARDLHAHLTGSLGFSCPDRRPCWHGFLRGGQSENSIKCDGEAGRPAQSLA